MEQIGLFHILCIIDSFSSIIIIYNHNLLFQFSEKRKWNKNEVLVDLS